MDRDENRVQADPNLLRRVEALVVRTQMSRDEIVNEALRGYLDWQEDFVRRVQEGIDAADQGNFASQGEVDRVFNKYRPS